MRASTFSFLAVAWAMAVVLPVAAQATGASGFDAPPSVSPVGPGFALGPSRPTIGGNVLLILADDVGVDQLRLFAPPAVAFPPRFDTPNIDALAARGVRFANAWANPLCSPTRVAIHTGRYAFRTGIGAVMEAGCCGSGCASRRDCCASCPDYSLPAGGELPTRLPGYATAAFGKWHMEDKSTATPVDPAAPCSHGYDFFSGTLWQVPINGTPCSTHVASGCAAAEGVNYCDWTRTDIVASGASGCVPSAVATQIYMPAAVIDAARGWLAAQPFGAPVFGLVAPQAPYELGHVPPQRLQDVLSGAECAVCTPRNRDCYLAALEALDTKIGELLAQLGPLWWEHTTVILVGDNGTPAGVSQTTGYYPAGHAKGSLYDGGVNVPMIVAGRVVEAGQWDTVRTDLVNVVDLHATVVEVATGHVPGGVDGESLVGVLQGWSSWTRTYNYAEKFGRNAAPPGPYAAHERAVRNHRFKLIDFRGRMELYDLWTDPRETNDLMPKLSRDEPAFFHYLALRRVLVGLGRA
ncbi:MAG: sulfatase-like hydrolase/transferase [Planctomycetota bacterium]